MHCTGLMETNCYGTHENAMMETNCYGTHKNAIYTSTMAATHSGQSIYDLSIIACNHLFNESVYLFSDCNAQLTSSSGRFTFCPGESVVLTCSLSSSGHVWRLSTSTTNIILYSELLENRDSSGNILFTVTGQDGGNILTRSTMTFTASVDIIANGTLVFCGGASNDMPTLTVPFNRTVNIFGEKSTILMC